MFTLEKEDNQKKYKTMTEDEDGTECISQVYKHDSRGRRKAEELISEKGRKVSRESVTQTKTA
ncbi:hypothetical protein C0Q70_02621 [Pomacea canaliculata]|uniref:Uncharacterized protein n=1 Tax=Pomacea canaliculata TaxID=400727 RepID=A0A2T7PQG4_POMCA|nr:hypothetical protein C0Q70_02621 [Pomacea canaliculata]